MTDNRHANDAPEGRDARHDPPHDPPHDEQVQHRHDLLAILFGPEVPATLDGQLLRTADVAALFQVSERTVSEWAKRGQIPSVRTPGGHRRYPADEIRQLLERDGRHTART